MIIYGERFMKKNYQAFTLSEVLITLGIVGVVAAMTLPTLMKNCQYYITQQQFKKVYSTISVASQKAQYEMGENVECFYGNEITGIGWGQCRAFYENLVKEMQIARICENNALSRHCLPPESYKAAEDAIGESEPNRDPDESSANFAEDCAGFTKAAIEQSNAAYILNDGTIFMPYGNGRAPLFMVDINGKKGPNKWGYDLFVLKFYKTKPKRSYFILGASSGCQPIEKGGYSTKAFIEKVMTGHSKN